MATLTTIGFSELLRDLRHMEARAARALEDWLVYLEVAGKAPGTLYQYTRQVAPLLRRFPGKEFSEFTDSDIELVLAHVPRQSRHITKSIYNSWFKWGLRKRRIVENPVERVAEIRAPHHRPKDIFSESEIALLEALPSPDGQLFSILFGTGLRRGEARTLRRDHVDLNRARLIVYHGKGDKDRIVPLPPTVGGALDYLITTEGINREDYLWHSLRGQGRHRWRRSPISDSTFDRWYRRCVELAGVRMLNPHQTRHTYGHLLREQGFDLEERRLLMGHEAIATTVRYYGTLTIEDVARKVALL